MCVGGWVWAYVCARLNCLCARVHAHNFSVTERERGREGGKQAHTRGQRDPIAQKNKDGDEEKDRDQDEYRDKDGDKKDTGGKEPAG